MDTKLTPIEEYILRRETDKQQTEMPGSEAQTETVESKIRRISDLLDDGNNRFNIGLSEARCHDFLTEQEEKGPMLLVDDDNIYFSEHGLDDKLRTTALKFKKNLTYGQILGYWKDEDYFDKQAEEKKDQPCQSHEQTDDLFA